MPVHPQGMIRTHKGTRPACMGGIDWDRWSPPLLCPVVRLVHSQVVLPAVAHSDSAMALHICFHPHAVPPRAGKERPKHKQASSTSKPTTQGYLAASGLVPPSGSGGIPCRGDGCRHTPQHPNLATCSSKESAAGPDGEECLSPKSSRQPLALPPPHDAQMDSSLGSWCLRP